MAAMPGPDRATLRQLLRAQFRTDQDFEAFCLDHFPEVHERFGCGMDRVGKTNLLLAMVPVSQVAERLQAQVKRAMQGETRVSSPRGAGTRVKGSLLRGIVALCAAALCLAGLSWAALREQGARSARSSASAVDASLREAPKPTPQSVDQVLEIVELLTQAEQASRARRCDEVSRLLAELERLKPGYVTEVRRKNLLCENASIPRKTKITNYDPSSP